MADQHQLLSFVEGAVSRLSGPRPGRWMKRLEESFGLITAALRDSLDRGDAEAGLRLGVAPGKFWWMTGRAGEGRAVLEALLKLPGGESVLRSRAFLVAGSAAYAVADYPACVSHLNAALPQCDERDRPAILNQLGMAAREQCRFADARQLHEDAQEVFEQGDDKVSVAWCVSNLGVVAFREGNLKLANQLHNDALERRRDCADERDIVSSLGNIATVARVEGRLGAAKQYHQVVLTTRERLKDRWGVAGSRLGLSLVLAQQGEADRATKLLEKAETTFRDMGDRLGLCECHDARVLFAAFAGQPVAELLAVAEQARADLGAPHAPVFVNELRHLTGGKSQVF